MRNAPRKRSSQQSVAKDDTNRRFDQTTTWKSHFLQNEISNLTPA